MTKLRLVILTALLLAPLAAQAADNKPALWAVYYAWYQTTNSTHGKSSIWTIDGTDQPRSRAQPLIGYYDSNNPDVVRWHVRLAKAAGIEAFLVDWWGQRHFSGPTLRKIILPIAEQENFKVGMCNELAQFETNVQAVIRDMADELVKLKASPACLKIDGKPAVYLYQVPFDPKLTPATFDELRRGVEAETGPVYWMMDKVSNDGDRGLNFPDVWLKIREIPMFGFYGTFSVRRMWKYDELAPHYTRLVKQAHAAGKKVFLPAHPGLDNSGIQSPYFIIPRDDGATLRGYLRAITDAGADVALLTSWNEWPETTVVEPSSSWPDPYFYLKLLAEWNGIKFVPPPMPATKRNQP
jgi:hypothetical protein